ncbi:hypothetical protein ACFSTC_15310 [Nonomuraea ferruginea]
MPAHRRLGVAVGVVVALQQPAVRGVVQQEHAVAVTQLQCHPLGLGPPDPGRHQHPGLVVPVSAQPGAVTRGGAQQVAQPGAAVHGGAQGHQPAAHRAHRA